VLLEGGAPVSKDIVAGLSAAAHAYTKLEVNTSWNPHDSDHVPFIRAGLPAVLTIEGGDETNANIHSAKDTLDRINYDLGLEILRMNTAFVADRTGV
jgi:Zn-dependent M28 family amino/carboxypeptidase